MKAFGARILVCLRFETANFVRLRLPVVAIVATLAASLIQGISAAGAAEPQTGWILFATMLDTSMQLALFFLVILGALAVNDEVVSGAMRVVLLRPVSRVHFVLAKVLVLSAFTVVLFGATLAVAWLYARGHGGFGAVVHDFSGFPVEKISADEMRHYGQKLCLAMIPGLLCAPILGILISVSIDAPGTAVASGVFTLGAMKAVGASVESLRTYCFTTHVDRPRQWLAHLARAIEENLNDVQRLGPFSEGVLTPLLIAAVLTAGSIWVFCRRELPC